MQAISEGNVALSGIYKSDAPKRVADNVGDFYRALRAQNIAGDLLEDLVKLYMEGHVELAKQYGWKNIAL